VHFLQTLLEWLRDPGEIIAWGGYPALALIVFLETGALVFFLPGDSLLVVAGFYAAKGDLNIVWLNLLLTAMAIAGDALSYVLGKKMGAALLEKQRWIAPKHVQAAHVFYEKHGGKAIVLARFVPVVRTFVPVVAGIARMGYKRFAAYNMIGGVGWVASMTLTGYFLGWRFPLLVKHIEKVVLVVVLLSVLPAVIEVLKHRRQRVP
jgi:membrane-associated protein